MLGSLVVRLGLDAAEFTGGLTKAQQQAQNFVGGITRSFANVAGAATLIAGGAATLVAGLNKAADTISVYKGLSEQMGATAEAVAALQSAADISGVSLDTVSTASIKLTSALARQDDEAKGVAAALKAINIPLEEFKRLDPVKQLEKVAEQLGKFEDGAGKTAVAVELFGRAGAQLIPFLNDLNDAGGRNVTLTQQQIEEADKFSKSLARMTSNVQSLGRVFAADLIPPVNAFIETLKAAQSTSLFGWLVSSGKDEQEAGRKIVEIDAKIAKLRETIAGYGKSNVFAQLWSSEDVKIMETQIAALEKQRAYLQEVFAKQMGRNALPGPSTGQTIDTSGFSGPEKEAKAPKVTEAQRYIESLRKQQEATLDLSKYEQVLWDIQSGRLKGITPAIEAEAIALAKAMDATKQYSEDVADVARVIGDFNEMSKQSQRQAAQTAEAMKAQASSYLDMIDPLRELLRKFDEINALTSKGYINAEQADEIKKRLLELKKPVDEINEYARNAAQSMQSVFADFFFDPFKDGLDGLAKNFAQTLQRMAADAVAAQLMKSLLGDYASSGKLGGLLGGLFSGGGTDGTRAAGGPVSAGSTYLVGERGPELFKPNAAGRIVPNGSFSGGGVSVTNNVTVTGGASYTDVARAMRETEQRTTASIRDRQYRSLEWQ